MASQLDKKPKFKAALDGLSHVLKKDRSFQTMVFISLIVVIGSFILQLKLTDFVLLVFLCFVVMAFEMINSAIERLADQVDAKYNVHIGLLKDISAGAVLLVSLGALVVGISVLIKYLGG